ncbi:hypothetical protein GCM10025864_39130 [Luteimicrobium album]|uniref:DUF7666 domain-containing protein n=1 Tax=Luteimicrobium album TaxID=1054550 RepID=A0ABQ6I5T4_9MICO|nr:hypothetical protein [Luteimicrobium album]GMA26154.1 hypothetical protein GCM10025864_39130 [Luteimicrobium album]
MTAITVHTQAELDAALAKHKGDTSARIYIESDAGVWLRINETPSSHVVARDSSRVVALGSSRVVALGSSRVVAWDLSHVVALGSSRVVAWDSSHVVAWDSSRVEAWDSSCVEARGSSRVVARDSSHVVAGKFTAVHLRSTRVDLSGGVVIDMTKVDATDTDTWLDLTGAKVVDGLVHLFKAVDDNLDAGHSYKLTRYEPGTTVTAPDWFDSHDCGYGLHVSPTVGQARSHYTDATRFLEVTVPVADIRAIDSSKVKARSVTVLREVDRWGEPIIDETPGQVA